MRFLLVAVVCIVCLAAPQRIVAQTRDTITLTVGHPSVDGTIYKEHWASAETSLLRDGNVVHSNSYRNHTYVTVWHGHPVCIVESIPTPGEGDQKFYGKTVLDQKSTALLHIETRDGTGRVLNADVDGTHVTGTFRASQSAPEEHLDFTLETPSYYVPFIDAAVGASPMREGQVWRVPAFSFGPTARKTKWHTLRVIGRESESAGQGMAGAWIVEDETGPAKIWITMDPPYLPQVLQTLPDGSVSRFASQLIPSPAQSLGGAGH